MLAKLKKASNFGCQLHPDFRVLLISFVINYIMDILISSLHENIMMAWIRNTKITRHRRTRWGGRGGSCPLPQNHLNLEKLGKFLSNYTKNQANFLKSVKRREILTPESGN